MLLNLAGVRRARLHAQLLASDPGPDVPGIVRQVVGIQAQDVAAAAMCFRARGPHAMLDDVLVAVAGRSIVLTWSLRGTRHFHHAEDIRWLVTLFGPLYGPPGRRAGQLGIAGEAGNRAVAAIHEALRAAGILTRDQVKEVLAGVGVDIAGQAPVHVLQRAALQGILCVVPRPHAQDSYALLDAWLPPAPAEAPAPAVHQDPVARLAARYLAAYGPATPNDFRAWSGVPAALAWRGWEGIANDVERVEAPGGPYSILDSRRDAVSKQAAEPGPVRLAGSFDTLLLGYAERGAHLAPEHTKEVNAGGGLIKPVVYDDGRVVATWRYVRARPRDRIEVIPLQPPSRRVALGVAQEAGAIGRFLGTDPVVAWAG